MSIRMMACGVALSVAISTCANAQAFKVAPPVEHFAAEQTAAIEYPELQFEQTESTADNFEKYFYFHRDDTSFDIAFHDLKECDALASGINFYNYADTGAAMAQYGVLAGGIGGAIGNLMADAIFGSAERRKVRRINMRRCMAFKGYDRYGLEKDLWQAFHFEEGFGSVDDDKRREYLLKQARVASGTKPEQEVLQP